MKKILILCAFLVSFSANAGKWKVDSTSDQIAITPFAIKKLMTHYKYQKMFQKIRLNAMTRILVGEDVGVINEVKVTTTHYKWHGETICQPNDPKLKSQTYGYMVCWATNLCEANSIIMLNWDPCL